MVHEEADDRFWLDPAGEPDSAHQTSVGVLVEERLTVDERIRSYNSRVNAANEQKFINYCKKKEDYGMIPPEPADSPGDTVGRESRDTGDTGSYGHLKEMEAQLYQISKAVGEEWTRLGQELGLEKSVLDNIIGDDNTQKALQMLKAWRTKTPYGPLHYLSQLEETLKNIGRLDLATTVQEAYKEYQNGVQLSELSPNLDEDKNWSLHLPGEGKYMCRRTGLGVVTPYPLNVTYRSANWSDYSWPLEGEEWMPVGPLFSIQCEDVEGPVDLLLPHVLADITEVTRQDLHVVHVVGNSPELLPVTKLTSSHAVTRFKKGSDFGLAGKKEKVRSVSRKGLFTAFRSLESSGISILNVYIVSNDRTVQATIEQDETKWHSSHCHTMPCHLYQGRKYYLKGVVTNGGDVSVSVKPEYLIFEDTLDNNKFYAPFRVEVSQDIWSSNTSRLHLELQEETNNDERKLISEVTLGHYTPSCTAEETDSGLSTPTELLESVKRRLLDTPSTSGGDISTGSLSRKRSTSTSSSSARMKKRKVSKPLRTDDGAGPSGMQTDSSVKDDVNDYFEDVVDAVSNKWDDLARKLGLTRNEIKVIETSERDNDHRCWEMLERWRQSKGREATREVLRQALIDIGERLTAERIYL
ncbi:uncharacterized protein LOC118414573 isoform X1 [Branchiostoma floridae]|uniref:Uncharacterized protein LOC118414573 isoform X1 n=1 Tax=Branchiostoma floridae TaxID=7739 RepID=A0A9J7L3A8_BRAFL|nr:uncharacterized protein LOC118414573 isoform X1 [Branchiostoma floridae]